MSATRLYYALHGPHQRLYNPADVSAEAVARYGHDADWTDAHGWMDDQYTRLFMFAAEESYRADLAADRAQLADHEFLMSQASMPFAGFCVYSLFDRDGGLLYVGQTGNAWKRIGAHAHKPWGHRIASVKLIRCATRGAALELEARLIREQDPPYNVALRWGMSA